THSEKILDALERPLESAVLCELHPGEGTRLLRPDPSRFKEWMNKFGGLGAIRREGLEREVYTREEGRRAVRGLRGGEPKQLRTSHSRTRLRRGSSAGRGSRPSKSK